MPFGAVIRTGYRWMLPGVLTVLLASSVAGNTSAASLFRAPGILKPIARTAPRTTAQAPAKRISTNRTLLAVVDKPDIKEHHKLLADRVLRLLPAQCRRGLKNFHVNYGQQDRRGYGGKTTIVLDGSVPDAEFVALLVHECGHVMHGNMEGTPDTTASAFRDGSQTFYANSPVARFFAISWESERVLLAKTKPEDFASGYARSDSFEDFAEFLVAYVLHPEYIAARAKTNTAIAAKLVWMRSELPLYGDLIAQSQASWSGTVPWDMTKLAIRLPANTNILTANVR